MVHIKRRRNSTLCPGPAVDGGSLVNVCGINTQIWIPVCCWKFYLLESLEYCQSYMNMRSFYTWVTQTLDGAVFLFYSQWIPYRGFWRLKASSYLRTYIILLQNELPQDFPSNLYIWRRAQSYDNARNFNPKVLNVIVQKYQWKYFQDDSRNIESQVVVRRLMLTVLGKKNSCWD